MISLAKNPRIKEIEETELELEIEKLRLLGRKGEKIDHNQRWKDESEDQKRKHHSYHSYKSQQDDFVFLTESQLDKYNNILLIPQKYHGNGNDNSNRFLPKYRHLSKEHHADKEGRRRLQII